MSRDSGDAENGGSALQNYFRDRISRYIRNVPVARRQRASAAASSVLSRARRSTSSFRQRVDTETRIMVTLPKPMTSGAKPAGRFGKQDFVYVAADDVYRCPAGERLAYRHQSLEDGKTIRRYSTSACKTCVLKAQCTTGPERRISRWEHEAVLEKVQDRLDRNPDKMRVRRQTVEHPFGTIKAWMGATHFQMRRLPKVASEMALHVLAYNTKRVMQILGVGGLMVAMRA
jgi:hypothetical protein